MITLSKFIVFNQIELERLNRALVDLEYDNFFIVELYNEDINLKDKNICYVGFNDISTIFNLDITENQINKTTYWLFDYEENKSYYRFNLEKYIKVSFENHFL